MTDPAAGSSSAGNDVSETTPLLAATDDDNANSPPELPSNDTSSPPTGVWNRAITAGTWVSLTSASLCFCFSVASAVIYCAAPESLSIPWIITEMIVPVMVLSATTIIVETLNLFRLRRLNRTLPVGVNVALDLLLAYSLIGNIFGRLNYIYFGCYRDDCRAWERMAVSVLWTFVLLCCVLGFTALFLLMTRILLACLGARRGNGSWSSWQFPAGQLSFEVTVKVLRPGQTIVNTTNAFDGNASTRV